MYIYILAAGICIRASTAFKKHGANRDRGTSGYLRRDTAQPTCRRDYYGGDKYTWSQSTRKTGPLKIHRKSPISYQTCPVGKYYGGA